jgi:hypothetical protein
MSHPMDGTGAGLDELDSCAVAEYTADTTADTVGVELLGLLGRA